MAPGVVALRATDLARAERSGRNSRGLGPLPVDEQVARWDQSSPPVGYIVHGEAAYLWVNDPGPGERTPTRCVTSWSRRSRARMVRRVAELDYSPLFAQSGRPAMVTLTYPGRWQEVAPDGATVKRHLDRFRKRWARRWGRTLVGLWKLEFQRRGAPHLHLFCVPPGNDDQFKAWLSLTWAAIVAADTASGERRRHVLAGTAVDRAEGARATDPKRLAIYFLKHGTKTRDDKEYQHVVPALWQRPGKGPGRFWGYWGLHRAVTAVRLDVDDYVQAKRLLRRWSRAQGRTHRRNVTRLTRHVGVVAATGEVVRFARHRTVTRRAVQLRTGGLSGGWVACNEGAALAVGLARALDVMRT